jgi:hypothetical protein
MAMQASNARDPRMAMPPKKWFEKNPAEGLY